MSPILIAKLILMLAQIDQAYTDYQKAQWRLENPQPEDEGPTVSEGICIPENVGKTKLYGKQLAVCTSERLWIVLYDADTNAKIEACGKVFDDTLPASAYPDGRDFMIAACRLWLDSI